MSDSDIIPRSAFDAMRNQMAIAILVALQRNRDGEMAPNGLGGMLRDAALGALRTAGYVVVPQVPTDDMLDAGMAQVCAEYGMDEARRDAGNCWNAMRAVAMRDWTTPDVKAEDSSR